AAIAIFLITLSFSAMGDVHEALMVDTTTNAERNRPRVLRLLLGMAGQGPVLVSCVLSWKSAEPTLAFVFTGLVVVAGTLRTVSGVRQPPRRTPHRGIAWNAFGNGLAERAQRCGELRLLPSRDLRVDCPRRRLRDSLPARVPATPAEPAAPASARGMREATVGAHPPAHLRPPTASYPAERDGR
ncbi:MAG TPA: hypothetical protein VFD32_11235, partial [Dehalococcoidia bacterium]|nr:hypothetical protein [Dehalococcoidia bacterium]